jgi:hypothetical protein
VDTASADPSFFAEYFPESRRVVVNPAAMARAAVPGRTKVATGALVPNEELPALMLGHELLGHGRAGLGSTPSDERQAEQWGLALLRATGRNTTVPMRAAGEATKQGALSRLLDLLGGP